MPLALPCTSLAGFFEAGPDASGTSGRSGSSWELRRAAAPLHSRAARGARLSAPASRAASASPCSAAMAPGALRQPWPPPSRRRSRQRSTGKQSPHTRKLPKLRHSQLNQQMQQARADRTSWPGAGRRGTCAGARARHPKTCTVWPAAVTPPFQSKALGPSAAGRHCRSRGAPEPPPNGSAPIGRA